MENEHQIIRWVHEIEETNGQIADHWSRIKRCVADAIPFLKAYFSLRTKLAQVEAKLEGTLGGYLSDK